MPKTIIPDYENLDGRAVVVFTNRPDGKVLVNTKNNSGDYGPGVLLDDEGIMALVQALVNP